MSIEYPPPTSPKWTASERLAYVAWIAFKTLNRIDADNPSVPLLSKKHVRDLFHAIGKIAAASARELEDNRAALFKPYDSGEEYHGVIVPQRWLDWLKTAEDVRTDLLQT